MSLNVVRFFGGAMVSWPAESYSRKLPLAGSRGSFGEDRGDRLHCGIDIPAPQDSPVYSTEEAEVVERGVFTSPSEIPYWNTTYYILVETEGELFLKYAELESVEVEKGQKVKEGSPMGRVGTVLNPLKIGSNSPPYIQELKRAGDLSMLHFEVLSSPLDSRRYLGGNWMGDSLPKPLFNPCNYLE